MAGGMAALLLVIAVWLAPVAEQYKISGPLAKAITADVGPDVSAATFDYREPSLNFYLARPVMVLKGYEDIVAWARQGQPGVLVMTRASLEKALLATGPLGLREIAAVKGYNHSAGKWQEVVALRRANLP